MSCPVPSTNPVISIFPEIVNNDLTNFLQCTHTPNPSLPASTAPPGSQSVYTAVLDSTDFQETNGLYTSASDCEGGSDIAISYTCPGELAHKQRDSSSSTDGDSEITAGDLSKSVDGGILNGFLDDDSEVSQLDNKLTSLMTELLHQLKAKTEQEAKAMSDESLLSELEKILETE